MMVLCAMNVTETNMEKISIHDGLVSSDLVNSIYDVLKHGTFSPSQLSYVDGPEYRSMIMNLHGVDHPALFELMGIAYNIVPEADLYYLDRMYANATTMSDVPYPHSDSDFKDDLTILYYVNPEWSITYGGETVFLSDSRDEIIRSVIPKAGRLVVFNSAIPHCPRVHNRIGPNHRFTIAFKLVRRSRYGSNKPV